MPQWFRQGGPSYKNLNLQARKTINNILSAIAVIYKTNNGLIPYQLESKLIAYNSINYNLCKKLGNRVFKVETVN